VRRLHGLRPGGHFDFDGAIRHFDPCAALARFSASIERIGRASISLTLPARGGCGPGKCELDAVGHDPCAVPRSEPTPSIRITSLPAPSMRAPIADRHLARSTPRARAPRSRAASRPREHRRHQQVLGAVTVTDHHDARPAQPLGAGMHVAMLDADRGAHRLQTLHVLIDRPQADRSSPREAIPGAPATREAAARAPAPRHAWSSPARTTHRVDDCGGAQRQLPVGRTLDSTPIWRRSLPIVETSTRLGALVRATRWSVSSGRAHDRQRRVLAPDTRTSRAADARR